MNDFEMGHMNNVYAMCFLLLTSTCFVTHVSEHERDLKNNFEQGLFATAIIKLKAEGIFVDSARVKFHLNDSVWKKIKRQIRETQRGAEEPISIDLDINVTVKSLRVGAED